MSVEEYRKVCENSIATRSVDLYATLSAYNFSFWFNGKFGYVILDEYGGDVAVVDAETGKYAVFAAKPVDCSESYEKLAWILGLDEDLSVFYDKALADPLLSEFAKAYPGFRLRATSLWWALVTSVCQQNASFKQGWRMLYNIITSYNKRVKLGDHATYLPPIPRDVLENPDLLEIARIGYRKEFIVSIAQWIENKHVTGADLKRLRSEDAEALLRSIRGVGSYTARLALVLSARKYDLPPIDKWLKKIVSEVYSVPEKDVEKFWKNYWEAYSGLASVLVTIALDAVPLTKALERIKRGVLAPVASGGVSPLTLWKYL